MSDDAHRISRRALFRGQLARWAGGEELPPRQRVDPARMTAAHEQATAAIRAGWEREGHEPWLRALEPVGAVLVEAAKVEEGMTVLDAGAGDGNVALAAVERGAQVTACDLAPAMVVRGHARCPEATWALADVQDLPYADGEFDAVVSAFGATLAPNAVRTARELVRVTRPGGMVVLAAWIPQGLPGALDSWVEQLGVWPGGISAPAEWGLRPVAERRLGRRLAEFEFDTRTVTLRFPSADALYDALALPLTLNDEQAAELRRHCTRLLAREDATAGDGVEIEARYALVRGRRPIPRA